MSGQIIPFLLVVMVVLLIAAIAVIQIGKVSIDKTYTDNAADAGSLAVASNLAAAFNNLTYDNYAAMINFENYRDIVENELFPEANYYLTQGSLCVKATFVGTSLGAALTAASIFLPFCADIVADAGAIALFSNAEDYSVKAVDLISAYLIMIDMMSSTIELCYNDQLQRYTNINDNLVNSYLNAKKEGFKYAFSNSGIESKLSDAQADQFNNWLITDMSKEVEAGNTTIKYSWSDKNSKNHEVSVTLELPKIKNYILWHTKNSLFDTQALYTKSSTDGQAMLGKIEVITGNLVFAKITSIVCMVIDIVACAIFWILGFGTVAAGILKAITTAMKVAKGLEVAIIISSIIAIINAVGADQASLVNMLNNAIADESWAKTDSTGLRYTSISQSPLDVVGLVIVAIEDIELEPNAWVAKACVTQTHPRVGISGASEEYSITSCSTSKFYGGHIKVASLPESPNKSFYVQAKERAQIVKEFQGLGSYFFPKLEKWVGEPIDKEVKRQEDPSITEANMNKSINANYSPEIVEVN